MPEGTTKRVIQYAKDAKLRGFWLCASASGLRVSGCTDEAAAKGICIGDDVLEVDGKAPPQGSDAQWVIGIIQAGGGLEFVLRSNATPLPESGSRMGAVLMVAAGIMLTVACAAMLAFNQRSISLNEIRSMALDTFVPPNAPVW